MKPVPDSLRKKARSPAEAKDRWRGFIQGTLACVNATVFLFYGSSPLGSEDSVTLEPSNNPIPLKTRSGKSLYLRIQQQGEIIKDRRYGRRHYRVTTRSYHYVLSQDVESKQPIVVWDWHPGTSPGHPYAHIHVAVNDPGAKGTRLHIPTGRRVTIEQIIIFLINDMDVTPATDNWRDIVDEHQLRFDTFQVQDPRSSN